jgi:hypothetical protein
MTVLDEIVTMDTAAVHLPARWAAKFAARSSLPAGAGWPVVSLDNVAHRIGAAR